MNDNPENFFEHYPLVDAIDHEILMHRDAHFGGQFSIMLDYYRREGKGVQAEIEIAHLEKLAALEASMAQNLAPLFLAGSEVERIADAKQAYIKLKEIYEVDNPKNRIPRLIADLILAEGEGEAEIQAIVAENGKAVPALIDLLRNEAFYDPLFPGYGQAPFLAAKCLGLIGDKRAIISLFEALGEGDFFADDQVLKALKAIGEPAKAFLLRVVGGHPINEDNEKAAIALIQFKDDEAVAKRCFQLLQDQDVRKDPCLPTYLVLACEELQSPDERQAFALLAEDKGLSPQLLTDMKAIIHGWNNPI